jgi:hypothetical protein
VDVEILGFISVVLETLAISPMIILITTSRISGHLLSIISTVVNTVNGPISGIVHTETQLVVEPGIETGYGVLGVLICPILRNFDVLEIVATPVDVF